MTVTNALLEKTMFPFLLLLMAGCGGPIDAESPSTGEQWSFGSAPSFMKPTSSLVAGWACAFPREVWGGSAASLLDDRWEDLGGTLQVGGLLFRDPAELRGFLATGGDRDAQRVALALNLALHEAGVYGMYADLPGARRVGGPQHGVTARQALALSLSGAEVSETVRAFNEGFGGCDPDWYLWSVHDADGDGVPDYLDCDDHDARLGVLLLDDDLEANRGYWSNTPELPDPWFWSGTSVMSTDGGQQALLGADDDPADIAVFVTMSAIGTRSSCAGACDEPCDDYVPVDCYTDWEALGLGILSAEATSEGVVTFTNSGDHDVCFDGYPMWDSASSQAITIGEETFAGGHRVPAGGTLDLHYGSYTTANGVVETYLGEPDLWCFQAGTTLVPGTTYASIGAWIPVELQDFITDETDLDGDGVEDHVDWAGSGGVQTQYNLWEYQENNAAVVVGKLARSTSFGTVEVTLTTQNRGALATTAMVEDTLPLAWILDSCSQAPDSEVTNPDGTTSISWELPLDGCTDACNVYDEEIITCEIAYAFSRDMARAELPAASAVYHDGDDVEVSWSMPAAAFNYDRDGDGQVACEETERWRAGVLARAELNPQQDEGYHGYRCALARNAEGDCAPAGHFLQVAEFMDAPEDEILSECVEDAGCPNPTFDQLSRVDHPGDLDISAGDVAELEFWLVGNELYCAASSDHAATVSSGRVAGGSFSEGSIGFSTLNMFGDFQHVRLCEAYSIP